MSYTDKEMNEMDREDTRKEMEAMQPGRDEMRVSNIGSSSGFQPEGAGSIPAARCLKLILCDTTNTKKEFHQIMDNYHAYMKYKDTCNRRINWLVFDELRKLIIGAVGINSAILAISPRDKFIGWDKNIRISRLVNIANNYRFCLIKEFINDKNTGTKVLKLLRHAAVIEWEKRYGDKLVLLETLVKPPWTGAVYKADNWLYVGMTKGTSFSKAPLKSWQKENSSRGELAKRDPDAAVKKYAVGNKMYNIKKSKPKLIFLRPLVYNWKDFLNARP